MSDVSGSQRLRCRGRGRRRNDAYWRAYAAAVSKIFGALRPYGTSYTARLKLTVKLLEESEASESQCRPRKFDVSRFRNLRRRGRGQAQKERSLEGLQHKPRHSAFWRTTRMIVLRSLRTLLMFANVSSMAKMGM